jgi:ectoine hydroxylase-related dioxygenase (phytanoyl-CoA dioxygenase family)
MVSDADIGAFQRDGFVVIPDLLSAADLQRYGAAVDAGVAARKAWDTRPLEEKSRYEQQFHQCINLWEDCPDVRPLTFHARVAEAAARLIGAECVRLWHDQALYKEPGGRATDPHQDWPYWPMTQPEALTAWMPLEGSTIAGGGLGYLAGSHAKGFRKFVNIFGDEDPDDVFAQPELEGLDPVFVEVPKGGVAFHHAMTFHKAMPNTTDRMRRVHTAIFFRDGVTRRHRGSHFAVDRPAIEPGAPIRSDVTPIAWPRPAGDLPWPPAPPDDSAGGTLPKPTMGG